MVWRILHDRLSIRKVDMKYRERKMFRLKVTLARPGDDQDTEKYRSEDINDAALVRHFASPQSAGNRYLTGSSPCRANSVHTYNNRRLRFRPVNATLLRSTRKLSKRMPHRKACYSRRSFLVGRPAWTGPHSMSPCKLGLPCGGWCPKGRRAEDGPLPGRYPLDAGSSPEVRQFSIDGFHDRSPPKRKSKMKSRKRKRIKSKSTSKTQEGRVLVSNICSCSCSFSFSSS